MSLKDHLENTGVRGSDHQGSHTQTHILKDVPESGADVQGQSSGDPRTKRDPKFTQHAHAGDTGTGSGQISPQTQHEPSADPSTGTVQSPIVRKGQSGRSR
jgi:hypothetical protein